MPDPAHRPGARAEVRHAHRVIGPAPPFDAELLPALAAFCETRPATVTPDLLPIVRADPQPSIEELLSGLHITHTERSAPGAGGAPDVALSMFTRSDHVGHGPGIYFVHGGGMISGDRFSGVDVALEWVERFDAVALSVEYRLAPEHPDPAPVEDCYAGLLWARAHADELGFDPDRLVAAGLSAGGGLVAGLTLLRRDRGDPALAGQLLAYPMLDDRNDTVSSFQIDGVGPWDRTSNDTGWDALLGERRRSDRVSPYAAPSRAIDLSGPPPTYIDVGSADLFRDEDVAYASAIWAAGGESSSTSGPGATTASTGSLRRPRSPPSSTRRAHAGWSATSVLGPPGDDYRQVVVSSVWRERRQPLPLIGGSSLKRAPCSACPPPRPRSTSRCQSSSAGTGCATI